MNANPDDYKLPSLEEELQQLRPQVRPRFYGNFRQSNTASSLAQNIFPMMLRMVGFDEQKLGMMALNMLVYFA